MSMKHFSYFQHDSNARNDDKMIALRMKHGAEGYGIYFMIIERLRESRDYMSVKDYNIIAFDLRVSSEKIKSVVEDFGLFVFTENGKHFYSESLNKRMEIKDERSISAKKAASARWNKEKTIGTDKQGVNADAMQSHSESNPSAMPINKERNKEIKKERESHTRTHEEVPDSVDVKPERPWQSYSIDELSQQLINSTTWKESVCMQYQLQRNDVDPWITRFAGHLKASGEETKNIRDAKKHFSSWLRIQLDMQKRNSKSNQSMPADNAWRFDKNIKPEYPGDWVWLEGLSRWGDKMNMNKSEKRRLGLL